MDSYPKIIHQIWITDTNKPLPEKWKDSPAMWKKIYPDYEYILWNNDRAMKEFDLGNFKYLIQKVDYLKYLIMDKYGGIYSDLDLYPLKRFDKLITRSCDCCIVKSQFNPSYYTNCFLMGKPNTKIWKDILSACRKRRDDGYKFTKHIDVTRTTGSWLLTSVTKNRDVYVLPDEFNPNVLDGKYESEYFRALEGQSWVAFDTKAMVWIYKNRILLLIIVLVILIIILLI